MTSPWTRVLYGTGGGVYAVKEASYTMFILMFYSQVLGLSGAVTGLIIALSLVWDAISDPLVGALSDRHRSRFGRRHPFMALSILPLGLGFIGLFTPPAAIVENQFALAGWLLFWSLWVRTFVTTFSIPHMALSAEITSDYQDRSQVLGARMGFMFLVSVLLPTLALLLIFPQQGEVDGRFDAARYPLYGLLSCLTVWWLATTATLGTRRYIRAPQATATPGPAQNPGLGAMTRDLRQTLHNRTFRRLISYEIAAMAAYGAIATLNMLVWTYFWEFSAREISIILSLPSLIAIVLVMLSLKPLGARLDKHRQLQLALVGLILNCLWLYPLKLAGVLEQREQLSFALNFIFMLLFMYFFLLRTINTQSIVADITDEHELAHGVRQEAGFFSVINFVNKFATVFGPLYGGIALQLVGLDTAMRPGSVPESTLLGLALALCLGVVPPLCIALMIVLKIDMGRHHVAAVQAALAQRRGDVPAATLPASGPCATMPPPPARSP